MARSRIPSPLTRRHLLEKDLSEAQARDLAEAYLAEDRSVEALDFLAKAGDRERLGELRASAVTSGDVFLLRAAARAMGESPTANEWRAAATAAATAGRELDAATAGRQIERGEGS